MAPFVFSLLSPENFSLKIKGVLFIPAVLYFILTLVLLSVPGTALPRGPNNYDKLVLVGMFFGLCFMFCRPFQTSSLTVAEKRSWFLSIALYGCAYGIIMEFVQKYLIPFRSYDVWDMACDALGCFLGFLWSVRFFSLKR